METKRTSASEKGSDQQYQNPAENSNKTGMEKHPLEVVIRGLSEPAARVVSGV